MKHDQSSSKPQAVENVSIRKDAQHDVVCGGVVDEGPLRVHKEDIRDPDLLHQAAIERHALVGAAGERQALVLPVVPQVQSHGEVLVESKDGRMRHRDPLPNNTEPCWKTTSDQRKKIFPLWDQ